MVFTAAIYRCGSVVCGWYRRAMRRRARPSGEPGVETMLGPLAGRIIRIVLTNDEVSVREVAEALARSPAQAPAYTTVMTIMTRLHERGLLDRVKRGKSFVYRAAMDENAMTDELSRRAVDQLLATYGTSAMRQFAAHLGDLEPSARDALIGLATERRKPS